MIRHDFILDSGPCKPDRLLLRAAQATLSVLSSLSEPCGFRNTTVDSEPTSGSKISRRISSCAIASPPPAQTDTEWMRVSHIADQLFSESGEEVSPSGRNWSVDAITGLCSSLIADVPAPGTARTNTSVAPSAQSNGTKLEYVGAKTTDPPKDAAARSCALPQPKLWIEFSSAVTVVLVSISGVTASSISCKTSQMMSRLELQTHAVTG